MDETNLPKAILDASDVIYERPNWTTEQAQAWLDANTKRLSEAMRWAGLGTMEHLLDQQHPKGEFCECCEDYFDASYMIGDTCKHCVEFLKGQTSDELQ